MAYYVNELDGKVTSYAPGYNDPYRVFSDSIAADRYSATIRKRLEYEKQLEKQLENSSPTSPVNFYDFLKFIFFIVAIFGFIKGPPIIKNITGKREGYITTKVQLKEYGKIEDSPLDKQIGLVARDTVFKLRRVKKAGSITWVEVYKLNKDSPTVTYILLPEAVKSIERENKYLTFNKKSKTWQGYYDRIDAKNSVILKGFQTKFKNEVKDIKISQSSDNVLRESIKNTMFIFDKDGYLGLYKSNGKDFYYINKDEKYKFIKIYEKFEEEYKNAKIPYFPK